MADAADRKDLPVYLRRGRIPSLDGMRGIAILLVLLAHVCQTNGFPGTELTRRICTKGGVGVEIFFVLSGFLITTLMLRELDRTGQMSIRHFYVRRVLRIVPAYACFLLAILGLVLIGELRLEGREWAAALTYTVNFLERPAWEIGHVWSLSIEEHFYLLWPLVMGFGRPEFARRMAMGVIAAGLGLRWAILAVLPQYSVMAELWTFTRLDGIGFGSLVALGVREASWRRWLDGLCQRNWVLVLAGGGLVVSLWISEVWGKFAVGAAFTVNAVAISLLVWAAVRRHNSAVGRILNGRALSAIGVGSYSLYLWQQIFLNRHETDFAYSFPQNLVFAGAAACCSYWLIERPFLKLKDRLAARSEPSDTRRGSLPARPGTAQSDRSEASIVHA